MVFEKHALFPWIIFLLHIFCFFIVEEIFFFVLCLELITWPFASKFAGPYWKHVIFIPLFLFVCCLPLIICGEAYLVDVSGIIILCFPIASLATLYFCGDRYPQEGKLPEWPAYVLLALPYPAWLLLLFLAGLEIHTEIFHRCL